MPYLTATMVDNRLGEGLRTKLCADSADTYQSSIFEELRDDAEAYVTGAISNSGYSMPASPPQLVQRATFAVWLVFALGRRDIGQNLAERFPFDIQLAQQIISGDMPIPGLTASVANAVGGVSFSENDSDISPNRAPNLGVRDMDSW